MFDTSINLAIQQTRVLHDQQLQQQATMAAGPLSSSISASFEVILHCNTHPPEPPTSILLLSAQTADQSVQNSSQTDSLNLHSITSSKEHHNFETGEIEMTASAGQSTTECPIVRFI